MTTSTHESSGKQVALGGPIADNPDQAVGGAAVVVPVVREELQVEKQTVETGRVRIHKTVHERVESIDAPLYSDDVEVERVCVNQFVDSAPALRREGDTLIVPLVEEVLVKRLVLREEIRIRCKRGEVAKPEPQTLRYEQVQIERTPSPGEAGQAGSGASQVESQQTQVEKET